MTATTINRNVCHYCQQPANDAQGLVRAQGYYEHPGCVVNAAYELVEEVSTPDADFDWDGQPVALVESVALVIEPAYIEHSPECDAAVDFSQLCTDCGAEWEEWEVFGKAA